MDDVKSLINKTQGQLFRTSGEVHIKVNNMIQSPIVAFLICAVADSTMDASIRCMVCNLLEGYP